MAHRCLLTLIVASTVILVAGRGAAAEIDETASTSANIEFFEQNIRPVLAEHCYQCHSSQATEIKGALRLDHSAGWLKGGESGPALIPGSAETSLILKAIRYDDDVSPMPPDRKLPDEVVAKMEGWINRGATAPLGSAPKATPTPDASTTTSNHWAFLPPQPAQFDTTDAPRAGLANRVDRILDSLRPSGDLTPTRSAAAGTLVRRLYYDLIGLPPSYEQVQAFLDGSSPNQYVQLVDSLLASPRFGERWARYWLDLARFSDTKGYVFTQDRNYPDAYKYRDWVIRALNDDRPFDEFVQYQLAADQLAGTDPEQLAAMGFLTLGRRFLNNPHDIIDDRIDVTMRGLMGLTVTCARCHDHKYDPIPTADYYSLYGVFASSQEPGDAPSPLRLVDAEQPTTPVVFVRGQPGRRGDEVPRQFLGFISGPNRQPFQHGSGRLEMAKTIASADNPLTARVFVNRVWGHLFGSHIVDTPSDFGTRSPRPALADLLDDLAVEFVRHDWSIKWLIRELVLSSTYQQAAIATESLRRADPENQWFTRMNRRRLDFESLRDSLLLVSGQLQDQPIGGPSVDVEANDAPRRRSLYAHIDRQNFPALFRVFDVASPDTHAPKRFETTIPQQALYLLNSPFVMQCAERLAPRTQRPEQPLGERVRAIYRHVLARDPNEWELQRALEYVNDSIVPADTPDAWERLSQILMVSNEFYYLD